MLIHVGSKNKLRNFVRKNVSNFEKSKFNRKPWRTAVYTEERRKSRIHYFFMNTFVETQSWIKGLSKFY